MLTRTLNTTTGSTQSCTSLRSVRSGWTWSRVQPRESECSLDSIDDSWLFLVDIVLCIGAFCHSQLNLTTDYFLNSALNRITSEHLEAGSLTLVQAYCLLSDISHKRDKPNAGSVYMGKPLDGFADGRCGAQNGYRARTTPGAPSLEDHTVRGRTAVGRALAR